MNKQTALTQSKTWIGVVLVAILLFLAAAPPAAAAPTDPDPAAPEVLLTEIVVTPTAGEFIEIYNPTGAAVDISGWQLWGEPTWWDHHDRPGGWRDRGSISRTV